MSIFYVFLALCLFGGALARLNFAPRNSGSSCPMVETLSTFDEASYMGLWYEFTKYYDADEKDSKCITSQYTAEENGTISIFNSGFSTKTGAPSSIFAVARVPDPSEPAKLKVKFPTIPHAPEGDYWILGTDYISYSVVYSCTNFQNTSFIHSWILTRKRKPSPAVFREAIEVAERNMLKMSQYIETDQNNCPVK